MSNAVERVKVSVVCAWFNRSDYIEDTLKSLLNQDFESYEIIIVNDGSTDKNVENILDSFKNKKLKTVSQNNSGFVSAIKHAINLSKGDFIAIQGAGDVSISNRLKIQYDYLLRNPKAVAVGSGCRQVSAESNGRKRYFEPLKKCSRDDLYTNMPFVHGTVMYRKKFYEESGGYDERFRYCSDWDLFFRLIKLGEIHSIDKCLYEQRMFSDGFSFSPTHKFKQLWFKERVLDRSDNSREMLDKAEEYISGISEYDKRYLKPSFVFGVKAFVKGDYRNAFQWMNVVRIQFIKLILFKT